MLLRSVFVVFLSTLFCVGAERLNEVEFSARGGLHHSPVVLSITSRVGAIIYYTTNGTPASPTNGTRYAEPLRLGTTTTVRAMAGERGKVTTAERVVTFIFPESVVRQDGSGFPISWGTNKGAAVPADYEMDPEVVTNAASREMVGALESIPSLPITLNPSDLFGEEQGIYAHPQESGDNWERPAFCEFFPTNAAAGFRVPAGLRIQGGWNRRPEESPKHSFRIVFKKKYGVARLKSPLFGDGVQEFDQLILRGGNNHSWLHWSAEERRSADYLRDQWMRESYAAMGRVSARGRFVHLYLNRLYWGIYNLVERPDEHFAAAHFGGKESGYDSRNADKILSGDDAAWKQLFALANRGVTNHAQFAAVGELLDVRAFCDYMLLNLFGANADWDAASNWYACRRRNAAGRFVFCVWDGERTLEKVTDNRIAVDDDFSPTRLWQKLRACAEFREMFAGRAKEHLTGRGALTPEEAANRFRRLSERLDLAILAESARWGDYRRDVHSYKEGPYELYTRDIHWRPEVKRLLDDYFPRRTSAFIEQLKTARLFPAD